MKEFVRVRLCDTAQRPHSPEICVRQLIRVIEYIIGVVHERLW